MLTPENPKKAYGAVKPCAHYAPMNTLLGVFRVFELGAKKYGLKNWRKQPVEISTYYNAAQRHLIEFFEEGVDADPESGQSPLDHAIADLMIIRDGMLRGSITDDRKKTEVLTPGEVVRRNIEFAGGDVPLTAQPQTVLDSSPPEAPGPFTVCLAPLTVQPQIVTVSSPPEAHGPFTVRLDERALEKLREAGALYPSRDEWAGF